MLNSTRTHRVALGLVAAGSALALAACGADDPAPQDTTEAADPFEEAEETGAEVDASDFNQGPVPAEKPELDVAELPPEPDSAAPLADRIAWEGLEQVATFASTMDPDSTYQCPEIAGEEGESVTCTVTFLGEDFDYTIDIESTGVLVSYAAELPEGPLVREVVEDTLRVETGSEYVLCDMDSDLVRGQTDTDAPFTCSSLDEETGDVSEYTLSISMYGAYTFFIA